jgi:hypothetical protein
MAHSLVEENRDMNENFKNTEIQNSRLQYRITTCEEKYKETQEILEALNESVSSS